MGVRGRFRRCDGPAERLVSAGHGSTACPARAKRHRAGSGDRPGVPAAAVAALASGRRRGPTSRLPLSALCGKRLMPGGAGPWLTDYQFSHILVRDAAYDRLLKRTRARLHERFADWLLEHAGSRVAEFEEIIGYHLEQSFRYRSLSSAPSTTPVTRCPGRATPRRRRSQASTAVTCPAAASLLQRAAALLDEGHPARPRLLLEAGEALTDAGELAARRVRRSMRRATARRCSGTTRSEGRPTRRPAACATPRTPTRARQHRGGRVRGARGTGPRARGSRRPPRPRAGLAAADLRTQDRDPVRHAAARLPSRHIRHATQAGDEVMARRFVGTLAISRPVWADSRRRGDRHCEEVLSRAARTGRPRRSLRWRSRILRRCAATSRRARARYRRSRALLEEFGYRLLRRPHLPRLVCRRDAGRRSRGGGTRAPQGLPNA